MKKYEDIIYNMDLNLFVKLLEQQKDLKEFVRVLSFYQYHFALCSGDVNFYEKINDFLYEILKENSFKENLEEIGPFLLEFSKNEDALNIVKTRLKKEDMLLYNDLMFFCGKTKNRGEVEMVDMTTKENNNTFQY